MLQRKMPPVHPAANLFPMLPDSELQALAEDIKANGLQHPIVMFGAHLLDGRNRWRACELAGVEPKLRDWSGSEEQAIRFVGSVNLKRRDLTASQKGAISLSLLEMEEAVTKRGRPTKEKEGNISLLKGKAAEKTGASAGVNPHYVSDAKAIKKAAPELLEKVIAGTVTIPEAKKLAAVPESKRVALVEKIEKGEVKNAHAALNEFRRQERTERLVEISRGNRPLEAPDRYPLILCDPPWRYEHVETESRAIENQYPTMALEEICSLPVEKVALDDCILFMWTTQPKLAEAMRVIESWGFNYRSGAVWDKQVIGMGYYFRIQVEHLLIAVKGEPPTPAPKDRLSNLISVRRSAHSEKPIEVYEIIERMYPTLPKIELFCRKPRTGWHAWGNQA